MTSVATWIGAGATAGLLIVALMSIPNAKRALATARDQRCEEIEATKREQLWKMAQALLDAEGIVGLNRIGSTILWKNPGRKFPQRPPRTITLIMVDKNSFGWLPHSPTVTSIVFHYSQTECLHQDVEKAVSNIFWTYELPDEDKSKMVEYQLAETSRFKHQLKIAGRYVCLLGVQTESYKTFTPIQVLKCIFKKGGEHGN